MPLTEEQISEFKTIYFFLGLFIGGAIIAFALFMWPEAKGV